MDDFEGVSCARGKSHAFACSENNAEQVFLENQGDNATLDAGTFIGKGGPGEFKLVDSLSEAEAVKAWRYTRLYEYQKDTNKNANGGIILGPVPGEGIGQWQQTKIATLQQIEEIIGGERIWAVYGHSITRGKT